MSQTGKPGDNHPDPDQRKALGASAEIFVAGWLLKNGYEIIERNFRCRTGEIDIIARKERHLCFVEVRSRSTTAMGSPALTVDNRKQRQIIRTAMFYLAEKRITDMHGRFDVAAVTYKDGLPMLEYLPAAFEAGI